MHCVYFFPFKTNKSCNCFACSENLQNSVLGSVRCSGAHGYGVVNLHSFKPCTPQLECCMQVSGWTTQFSVHLFSSTELPCRSSTEISSYSHWEVGPSREQTGRTSGHVWARSVCPLESLILTAGDFGGVLVRHSWILPLMMANTLLQSAKQEVLISLKRVKSPLNFEKSPNITSTGKLGCCSIGQP